MTAEIFLAIGLVWVVAVSVVALVLCYRLRVAERRKRVALKFDPMAFHGVEAGDINRRRSL
jgi:hypothetical protein